MKTLRLLPLIAVILLAAGCQTATTPAVPNDGRVTVTFDQPDKFTDAKASFGGGTEQSYLDELKHFIDERSRAYLDASQRLAIKFTDIDMAGDFQMGRPGLNDVRIIKSIYTPRLKFSYTVTDAAGKTVSEGDENLSDMSFMMRTRMNASDTLFYEKGMLTDWMSSKLRK